MEDCICKWAAPVNNRILVQIFMHHKEASRRSNSAHLLTLNLERVKLEMHGAPNQPTRWPKAADARRLCVLFPYEGASVLTKNDSKRFDQLVVLDGNWRQAKKAANRIAKACNPVFKTLPTGEPSEFKLRKQSEKSRLSTYEATVRALSILEDNDFREQMMPLFHAHVRVTLNARSRRNWANRQLTNVSPFCD